MLSASRRQPHLLHVNAVDRRQIWSMDKSWRCVTLSGFLHSHTVRCRWNSISSGTHYGGPGLSENDLAVTTDVGEDLNREVGLWGLPLKWNLHFVSTPGQFVKPRSASLNCVLSMQTNRFKREKSSTSNNGGSQWTTDDSCSCSCIGQVVPGHSKVFTISQTSNRSSAGRRDQLIAWEYFSKPDTVRDHSPRPPAFWRCFRLRRQKLPSTWRK